VNWASIGPRHPVEVTRYCRGDYGEENVVELALMTVLAVSFILLWQRVFIIHAGQLVSDRWRSVFVGFLAHFMLIVLAFMIILFALSVWFISFTCLCFYIEMESLIVYL
jgi:uncharacterized membrane protein YdbT with pleckstrin-like domain